MLDKILIVGSNSIISKHIVAMLKNSYELDLAFSGKKCGITKEKNINPISIKDLTNSRTYKFVIIISAYIPNNNEQNNQQLFDINVKLIEEIVTLYANSKIIYCSSVSVYPPSENITTEQSLTSPINEYALSKLWAEKIIQRNAKSHIILRISSLIGIGMKENTFLPIIIKQAVETKKIKLVGNGNRKQNYIDAEQLSKIIVKCLKYEKNNVFLAVDNVSYTNNEIAQFVKNIADCEIEHIGVDNSWSAVYDNSYTKNELNFEFDKQIEKSISEIIEWKLKQL